ncbi:MAG: beta-ketoacyl synthase N-terminal-like domain-containing protein [Syntrophobacter sp.]
MNIRRARNLRPEEIIVITGSGAICPLGNSVGEIRSCLVGGKPVEDIQAGPAAYYALYHNALRTWKTPELKTDIQPQLAKSMGKHLSLLLLSAEDAFEMAGLAASGLKAEDIGFFAGMGMVDYHVDDLIPAVLKSISGDGGLDYEKFFSSAFQEIYPLWPLAMLNNVAFCQVAIHLGLRGENCVFTPHADAGSQAVAEGVKILREGKARAVLAGAVSEEVSPLSLARAELNGLSGPPVFLGECGASLVLEPLAFADQRGARPLAAITGFGFASEGGTGGGPTSRAVVSSMKTAISEAGLAPEDIDIVIAGSVGVSEARACEEAAADFFGARMPVCLFPGRVFGETFAAGPILNAIIGVLIFESSTVPKMLMPTLSGAGRNGSGVVLPAAAERALIMATSYEGRCASFVIEKPGQ